MSRTIRSAIAMLAAVAAIGVTAACEGGATSASDDAKPAVTTSAPAAAPTTKSPDEVFDDIQASNSAAQKELQDKIDEASKAAEEETGGDAGGEVPNVVGMNHAEALTELHAAGFMVDEEDASPEGRMIILNSGWKVCRQDPGPGATTDIRITIYSVKLDESC